MGRNKENFVDYWDSNPDERKRGVVYKRVILRGVKFPYVVSNEGVVRNIKNNHIIKPYSNNSGYLGVDLYLNKSDGSKRVKVLLHRLVGIMFLGLDDSKVINHKDFNPKNNNVDNLEIVDVKDNIRYSWNAGRMKLPDKNDPETIEKIKRVCEYLEVGGITFKEIAKFCDVDINTVRRIYNGDLRSSISKNYTFKPRKYFVIDNETALKICDLLESNQHMTDQEIALLANSIPEFVKGVRDGRYRKDISRNRILDYSNNVNFNLEPGEEIKQIVYSGLCYNLYISNFGNVYSANGIKIVPIINNDGFYTVNGKTLSGYNSPIPVHIAVANAFVSNPNNYTYIGFKDLNKLNCRADNLIWLSESERRGMTSKSKENELTADKARAVCQLIANGESNIDISKKIGLSQYMVKSIRDKKIIKWISDKYFSDGTKRVSKSGHKMSGNKRFTDDELMEMLRLKNMGWKSSEVAKKFNTSKEYVNKLVKGDLNPHILKQFMADRPLVIKLGTRKYARSSKLSTNW